MKLLKNNTIVVPFDFSENAVEAVETALELAEDSTSIHVINVVDPTPIFISIDPALPVPAMYDHDRFSRAQQRLLDVFGSEKYSRLNIECVIGQPSEEIVEFSNRLHANLIIMPSHGRTGLARLLLGSVAERVLRTANCPVLIMRKPN